MGLGFDYPVGLAEVLEGPRDGEAVGGELFGAGAPHEGVLGTNHGEWMVGVAKRTLSTETVRGLGLAPWQPRFLVAGTRPGGFTDAGSAFGSAPLFVGEDECWHADAAAQTPIRHLGGRGSDPCLRVSSLPKPWMKSLRASQRSGMASLGLGLLVALVGWVVLVIGIVLGNVRVVGIGAAVIFVSEMLGGVVTTGAG